MIMFGQKWSKWVRDLQKVDASTEEYTIELEVSWETQCKSSTKSESRYDTIRRWYISSFIIIFVWCFFSGSFLFFSVSVLFVSVMWRVLYSLLYDSRLFLASFPHWVLSTLIVAPAADAISRWYNVILILSNHPQFLFPIYNHVHRDECKNSHDALWANFVVNKWRRATASKSQCLFCKVIFVKLIMMM